MRIANVSFYLYLCFGDAQFPLAMATLFSTPDELILSQSSDTVYLCEPIQGNEGTVVIPISSIRSVVAMFPEIAVSQEGRIEHTGKFSLMRHPYIELSDYSTEGFTDEDEEPENNDVS